MTDHVSSQERLREGLTPEIAVVTIASGGLEDFALNTIGSMLSCGVRADQVFLFHADAAAGEYASMAKYLPQDNILPIQATLNPRSIDIEKTYADYGTDTFNTFTRLKLLAVRWLMAKGAAQVVYTDLDIVWIRNPLNYLKKVAKRHDLAVQNESDQLGLAHVCAGFMSLKNTAAIDRLSATLIGLHEAAIADGRNVHDQQILNEYLQDHRKVHQAICFLPAAQFPNGLFAPMFAAPDCLQVFPLSLLRPMIFHANWCMGLRAKKDMLERAGLWRPGEWPVHR